jgi:phospholipid transport system transporter-binding protein
MMKLPSSLTMATTSAAYRELTAAVSSRGAGSDFAVDASALREVDSSALALLLDLHRQAQARGLRFTVGGVPPRLRQLAVLYGVEGLLGM